MQTRNILGRVVNKQPTSLCGMRKAGRATPDTGQAKGKPIRVEWLDYYFKVPISKVTNG